VGFASAASDLRDLGTAFSDGGAWGLEYGSLPALTLIWAIIFSATATASVRATRTATAAIIDDVFISGRGGGKFSDTSEDD
jgi:hypothetical protein